MIDDANGGPGELAGQGGALRAGPMGATASPATTPLGAARALGEVEGCGTAAEMRDAVIALLGVAVAGIRNGGPRGLYAQISADLIAGAMSDVIAMVAQIPVALTAQPVAQEPVVGAPEEDDRWCAGSMYALTRLCAVLKVDHRNVDWDGSDGGLDEEADALIWRILRANDPDYSVTPAPVEAGLAQVTRYSPFSTGNNRAGMEVNESGKWINRVEAFAALRAQSAPVGGEVKG